MNTVINIIDPTAWLFSSTFHFSNTFKQMKLSRLKAPSVIVFPGPRICGDGGAVQRRSEETGLAIAPDLPRAQHCLQGRPAAVLLRALLSPTLPGTRSTYTHFEYLHKRDRALVLLPFSPIATRSVALSASSGRPGDRAERRVQRARRRRPAASPGRELVQPVQRDESVSRGKDCRRDLNYLARESIFGIDCQLWNRIAVQPGRSHQILDCRLGFLFFADAGYFYRIFKSR